MFRRCLLVLALLCGCGVIGPLSDAAQACPMCKVANEQDSLLPQAYMVSILFMLGMIFSLGGTVGVGIYVISRREGATLDEMEHFTDTLTDGSNDPSC